MPHCYFNLCNGQPRIDKEGRELGSIKAARLEAIQRLGRFMTESPDAFTGHHDWRMEVTDGSGLMLFRIDLDLLLVTSPSALDT